MNPDDKNKQLKQLYTIVYHISNLSNEDLLGKINPYTVANSDSDIHPEIEDFTEANEVIARIKAGL